MNAMSDTARVVHSLESERISRGAAEAIAQGLAADRQGLATKEDVALRRRDLGPLRRDLEQKPSKAETDAAIAVAASRQTTQLGAMVAAATAIIIAAVGLIVSIH